MRIKHGNNVAVTSSGRVYVSNFKNIGDRKDLPPDLKLRKDAGDRADVYMTRFTDDDESAEWVQVARNISGANGLCLSPDEKQLYVAEYHRGRVLRFDVNADDGSLANPEFLPLSGEKKRYPDNITCDAEGNFALIAQHGKFETLAQGISQTLFKKAESSIHVLDGKTGVFAEEVEITHDPHNYPAASTAYRHKAHWIVSQIFGNRILVLHRNATKPKDRVIGAVHEKENET
ncbi:MAG: SMP-30/gluconolactonase/LRE family protein [Verrucomicrobia bacterium]|nr:SMP-30/gluconolactonase/LRE family protein [Verrucomicrobiota bacterium]